MAWSGAFLPQPDSPTSPSSAAAARLADTVDGLDELGKEKWGISTRRSRTERIESAVFTRAPGRSARPSPSSESAEAADHDRDARERVEICHSVVICDSPSEIIDPQSAVGGGIPMPR